MLGTGVLGVRSGDWVARDAALGGLLAGRPLPNDRYDWRKRLAGQAYELADAMLEAREKGAASPVDEVAGLRRALEDAAKQFRRYEAEHKAKAAAARARRFYDRCGRWPDGRPL